MWQYNYDYYDLAPDELKHHGVLGMRWGRRKQRAIRSIESMYNHSNKWTNRKIAKLDSKHKTAKANVMREMVKQNTNAKKNKIAALSKMTDEQFKNQRHADKMDFWFGGQNYKSRNSSGMTTTLSRLKEYEVQRGMRWMSNFTLNKTLDQLSPKEGYEYLNRKQLGNSMYNAGYNAGYHA